MPLPTLELCCAGCGYGARRRTGLNAARCVGETRGYLEAGSRLLKLAPSMNPRRGTRAHRRCRNAPLVAEHAITDSSVSAGVAAA